MATQALPAELGARATDFALKDVHKQLTKLADVSGRNGAVVVFICNHCPYVKAITDRLVTDAETLKNEGVSLVAINSNDPVSYLEGSFANMARFALERGFTFPYLRDETQAGPSPGRRMQHVNSSRLCAQLFGRGWARMCSIPRLAALSSGRRVRLQCGQTVLPASQCQASMEHMPHQRHVHAGGAIGRTHPRASLIWTTGCTEVNFGMSAKIS